MSSVTAHDPAMMSTIAQDGLCLLMCIVATITDVRSYRIPNWLSLAGIGCGLVLNALLVRHGWLHALAGGMLTGLVFGLFGALRFVGMGDVKLMTAVGALVGWPLAMDVLADVSLAGGLVALIYTLGRGQLRSVGRSLSALLLRRVRRSGTKPALHRIPYAVAILLGTMVAIVARYVPELRW